MILSVESLKNVIEKINDGIIICEADGSFVLWNQASRDILCMSEAIVSVDSWPAYYGAHHADKITPYLTEELPVMKAIRGITTKEEVMYVKHGNLPDGKFLSVTAYPIEENSIVVGAVAIFEDVTEKMKVNTLMAEFNTTLSVMKGIVENFLIENNNNFKLPKDDKL